MLILKIILIKNKSLSLAGVQQHTLLSSNSLQKFKPWFISWNISILKSQNLKGKLNIFISEKQLKQKLRLIFYIKKKSNISED